MYRMRRGQLKRFGDADIPNRNPPAKRVRIRAQNVSATPEIAQTGTTGSFIA
jgi:hypothetical protein